MLLFLRSDQPIIIICVYVFVDVCMHVFVLTPIKPGSGSNATSDLRLGSNQLQCGLRLGLVACICRLGTWAWSPASLSPACLLVALA